MPRIERLVGREILDSRGRPTVLATCVLEGGFYASASVPSGASTGTSEAHELRDGDQTRYGGLGCYRAVDNIDRELNRKLAGQIFVDQFELDKTMVSIDGTPAKSRLGANAILAVSIAFARANAQHRRIPLYQYFAEMLGTQVDALPRLTINLLSGGKHAGEQVSVQDLLIIPMSAGTVDEALTSAYEVYTSAADLVFKRYGMRLLTADEGGLAPPVKTTEEMITLAMEAIEGAGYKVGEDISLGLDVAASHFYRNGHYQIDSSSLNSLEMIGRITEWVKRFPILSLEDGLSEDDWEYWPVLRQEIGGRALTLGDDLLCTNPERIQRAIELGACDALLLKVNQIGTVSEALAAYKCARSAGWSITVSARSGETEDNWLADLAIGWRADQFKNGSIRHSERVAKYNRLLEVSKDAGWRFVGWPDATLATRNANNSTG